MHKAEMVTFGPFRLVGAEGPLWHGNTVVALAPKALAILWTLVTHAGDVVTKEAVFAAVWGETIVSDGVLAVHLRQIRHALGDSARDPQYIETVHRIGYRFIAPLHTAPPVLSPQFSVVSQNPDARSSPQLITDNCQLTTDLVGRDAELTQLHSLFAKAVNGERQVVFVTGEAGIGKTALVETFVQRLASSRVGAAHPTQSAVLAPYSSLPAPRFAWGQCIEHYGEGEAYLPLLEALGRLCRAEDGGRVLAVLRQYAPSWLVLLPALLRNEELSTLQQRITGTTCGRMLRKIVEALEVMSVQRPLVLILEDLHWSDASTVDVLNMLARRRETARLLVVGTCRPADLIVSNHPLKTIKQELVIRGQATEVVVERLRAEHVQRYVQRRSVADAVSPSVGALVYRRTEGHPLFMVQMVDYLEQQGEEGFDTAAVQGLERQLPQQLRAMIDAQVGRLTPLEQEVLEVGSVAGTEFTLASVAAALEKPINEVETVCDQLARRGQFIVEREVSRWPDGTVSGRYGFRHALYEEVLYQRVSASRRVRLHQQIGEREERGYGERPDGIAAELAMHFTRSHDALRAVRYHTVAAQHAIRRFAHREALTHITSALALVAHISDQTESARRELELQTLRGLSLANTQGFGQPETAEAYERAYALCREADDLLALAPVLFGLWNFWLARADLKRARELAEQLDELTQRQEDAALQGKAHTTMGQTYTLLGHFEAAFTHFRQGLALYAEQQHGLLVRQYGEDAGVSSHNVMGSVCWFLGFPDQARYYLLAGRQLAGRLAYPFLQAQNLWRTVMVLQCCGALDEMAECLTQLLHLCERETIPLWHAGGRVLHGWLLVHQGHNEEGNAIIQQGMQAWRATGVELMRPYQLLLLADAYGVSGQAEAGLRTLDEALELGVNTGERWWEAEIHRLYGELLLRVGERVKKRESKKEKIVLSSPEECFLTALEVAHQQHAKCLELRAIMSLVRLRQQQTEQAALRTSHHESRTTLAEAHKLLCEVYGWFTEGFDTKDLQDAKAMLESLRV